MDPRFLLMMAAIAMGAIAMWSMHFIGNRAIVMDKGQEELQIHYSPRWTAISFFVPTAVISIAFLIFNITENVNFFGTCFGGILTGASVCGMHYMGQGGITNYAPFYQWRWVTGSAVCAVFATTFTLALFHHFKSHWTNALWKRAICASFLALSISGMHWLATRGTVYRLSAHPHNVASGLSRTSTVVVTVLLVSFSQTLLAYPLTAESLGMWVLWWTHCAGLSWTEITPSFTHKSSTNCTRKCDL